MKQYELTITRKDESGKIKSFDKIESNDLVELIFQFQFVTINIQKAIFKENMKRVDDDIPF